MGFCFFSCPFVFISFYLFFISSLFFSRHIYLPESRELLVLGYALTKCLFCLAMHPQNNSGI
jgi:hypothetical protein